jgi:epsilon-lactone hydrolase
MVAQVAQELELRGDDPVPLTQPVIRTTEVTLGAYRALLDGGEDPSGIALAGDSAGGGLTVTTCLTARDAGLPMPAALVAFSPGLDAARTGGEHGRQAGIDPIFTREGMEHTRVMYLAGQDPHQPRLSPATLADLTGFPPMLLQAGTNEVLLDDSTRLAGVLDEADQALARAALFLTQHVRP